MICRKKIALAFTALPCLSSPVLASAKIAPTACETAIENVLSHTLVTSLRNIPRGIAIPTAVTEVRAVGGEGPVWRKHKIMAYDFASQALQLDNNYVAVLQFRTNPEDDVWRIQVSNRRECVTQANLAQSGQPLGEVIQPLHDAAGAPRIKGFLYSESRQVPFYRGELIGLYTSAASPTTSILVHYAPFRDPRLPHLDPLEIVRYPGRILDFGLSGAPSDEGLWSLYAIETPLDGTLRIARFIWAKRR